MKNLLFIVGILLMFSCGEKSEALFSAPSSAKVGEKITVKFSKTISSTEKNKSWITIVEKTKPDSDWGKWQYVTDKANSIELTCPDNAGEYEIRLHDMYPQKSNHVIARQDLTIK